MVAKQQQNEVKLYLFKVFHVIGEGKKRKEFLP